MARIFVEEFRINVNSNVNELQLASQAISNNNRKSDFLCKNKGNTAHYCRIKHTSSSMTNSPVSQSRNNDKNVSNVTA